MYSRAHGAISLAVGVALVVAGVEFVHPLVVVGYATAAGVLIDLDHFLLARYNSGSWRATRYLLSNPRRALADQSTIFEESEISPFDRLLSHVVIIGVVVPVTWWVDPAFGLVNGVVLYCHVLADLIADVQDFNARNRAPGL